MFEVLLSLAITVIAAVAGWAIKTFTPYIRTRISAEQQAIILALVSAAVTAAEQMPELKGEAGADKKAFVVTWLRTQGISTTEEKLDALIESAVYALKNGREAA